MDRKRGGGWANQLWRTVLNSEWIRWIGEMPIYSQRECDIVATPGNQRERVIGLVDGWTQTGKNRGADD